MIYEEMQLRPGGQTVRVYSVGADNMAVIFDPVMYMKNNNGWDRVKVSRLVPMEFELNNRDHVSKTRKNKAKSRLKLVEATWESTDGTRYDLSELENAIRHELDLMDSAAEEASATGQAE